MHKKKILIIGLDGFTWRIGEKLIREHHMPTLERLIQSGSRGVLRSVIPYETSPAWSSFQTGCYPAKTGIFAFHRYDSVTRQIKLNSFRDIRVPTLWEILSNAGKLVVSINMPMTSPPPPVKGVIIPGLTCPEISRETVYPPEIFDQYLKSIPEYCVVNNTVQPDLDGYVASGIRTENVHCELALKLMRQIEWDVFCIQIQSTDAFQHKNWWALDPAAEGYSEHAYSKAVKFYEGIDRVLGSLTEAAGDSVLTVIVSDHGFCAKKAEVGINTWLCQNGYLRFNAPESFNIVRATKDKIKKNIPFIKYLAGVYGRHFKGIWSLWSTDSKHANLYSEKVVSHIRRMIDLDRSFAFCLGGMAGSLYLIDPQKKDKAAEMIAKLLEAYGPKSGDPLISSILSTEMMSSDKKNKSVMPDYLLTFSDGVEARISPEGTVVVESGIQKGQQTGTHEQDGIFIFCGPRVRESHYADASIVDVMPTLLSYLSVPIPDHVDGKVLNEIFADPLQAKYQKITKTEKEDADYSDADQSAVEKQLEDLGYL